MTINCVKLGEYFVNCENPVVYVPTQIGPATLYGFHLYREDIYERTGTGIAFYVTNDAGNIPPTFAQFWSGARFDPFTNVHTVYGFSDLNAPNYSGPMAYHIGGGNYLGVALGTETLMPNDNLLAYGTLIDGAQSNFPNQFAVNYEYIVNQSYGDLWSSSVGINNDTIYGLLADAGNPGEVLLYKVTASALTFLGTHTLPATMYEPFMYHVTGDDVILFAPYTNPSELLYCYATNGGLEDISFDDASINTYFLDGMAFSLSGITELGIIYRLDNGDNTFRDILVTKDGTGYYELFVTIPGDFYWSFKVFSDNRFAIISDDGNDYLYTGIMTSGPTPPGPVSDPVPVPLYQPIKLGGQPAPTRRLLGSK